MIIDQSVLVSGGGLCRIVVVSRNISYMSIGSNLFCGLSCTEGPLPNNVS